jgi:hypothetical protein
MKVTCGRCKSEWEVGVDVDSGKPPKVKSITACPLCGFSRQDIVESKDNKKILKG